MDLSKALSNQKIFELVKESARELDFKTYVIGGFVRNYLLGRPSKDLDFVCVGDGIKMARAVAKKIDSDTKITVFKNFGTAMIKYGDKEFEFVGARKESYRKGSRKPIVEDGTLDDDLNRRDFTINALAISLNLDDYGTLVDQFGGQEDLKKKIIRTPLDPHITFSDDPLRMMRAIRFASDLSFDIESGTFEAISENSARLEIVSQERITDELNKIILSPQPSYGFKLLFQCKLLDRIFPEMVALHGVETIAGRSHKDNFYHTLKVLDNVSKVSDDLWLRWAAILHDIAKPVTKRFDEKVGWTFHGHEDKGAKMVTHIFRKLKLPLNEKMKFVEKIVRLHLRPMALVKESITDAALRRLIFEAGDHLDDLMTLCRADITSKNYQRVQKYLANFDKVEEKLNAIEEKDKIRNFQPALTGDDIMQIFNLKPSRLIGELKEELKEAILDGKINNEYQEAYDFLIEIAEKRGLTINC